MRVFVNPACDFRKGLSKWKKLEPELFRRYGQFDVEQIKSPRELGLQVKRSIQAGERLFIAAGGDGTSNLLLNALMDLQPRGKPFVLGSVGLGSSNDFHKPFRKDSLIQGIPVRMDSENAANIDVIQVSYKNGSVHTTSRFCLINASIGITAQANALYNSRLPSIVFMKRISHDAAVVVSALKTITTYRNIPCTLSLEKGVKLDIPITNLGVIKNPHFAGGLCYDMNTEPDDGQFGVNLCADMSKAEAVRTLVGLYRRKFSGYPKTVSLRLKELSVKSAHTFALEMDGEVVMASEAEFKVIPKAVWSCR